MMHLTAINTMASYPQCFSHSHFPLEILPSLAPLPVLLYPLVMFLAVILAADDLFLGSGSAHASFSDCLPLLYLFQGLDTLTTTTTIMETASTFSLIFAA